MPGEVRAQLVAELSSKGATTAYFTTFDAFLMDCIALGQILAIDDVQQAPAATGVDYGDGSIPFHSDGPNPDLIAWFCLHQDDDDGATLLTDSHTVLSNLSLEDQAELRSIQLPYLDMTAPEWPAAQYNVLYGMNPDDWRLTYAPWHFEGICHSQQVAIDRFASQLTSADVMRVRLERCEALFIDNWRILHARGPLRPESKRHLKRVWLRSSRTLESRRIDFRPCIIRQ